MPSVASPPFYSPFSKDFAFVILSDRSLLGHRLHPKELCALSSRASVKRTREFASGRAAACLALKQLGFDSPPPVLAGGRREPLWPEGVVGSITHCEPWTIVVTARRSIALAIGIDLESSRRIHTDDIAALICDSTERNWVTEEGDYRERLTMVFSAKEAAFKAFYPLCKRFIDFKEIRLTWIPEQSGFRGELLTALNQGFSPGFKFKAGCSRNGDLVLTYVVLSAT